MDFEQEPVRKFAFVLGSDVFFVIGVPDNFDSQGIIAGLNSKPQIFEVTDLPEVSTQSRYIDGEFYNPAGGPKQTIIIDDYDLED